MPNVITVNKWIGENRDTVWYAVKDSAHIICRYIKFEQNTCIKTTNRLIFYDNVMIFIKFVYIILLWIILFLRF